MAEPLPEQVHVDSALTTIAIAYKQKVEDLIADKVFPIVPVAKQSDRIFTFPKEYWMRIQAGIRAPGTESRGISFRIEHTTTYYCDVHACHHDVSEETLRNADIPNLEQQITEFLIWQLLLEREADWVKNFFDPTGKTPGVNFWHTASVNWTDATADPVAQILEASDYIAKNTGFRPNVLVLGPTAYRVLRTHPAVREQVVYAPGTSADVRGLVTPELLAKLFDLDKVLVGKASHAPGPEGGPVTTDFVFPDNALLVYAPPTPGLLLPSGGYIFEWTGFNEGYSVRVSTIPMPHLRSIRYEADMAYHAKLLGPDLGYLFTDVAS